MSIRHEDHITSPWPDKLEWHHGEKDGESPEYYEACFGPFYLVIEWVPEETAWDAYIESDLDRITAPGPAFSYHDHGDPRERAKSYCIHLLHKELIRAISSLFTCSDSVTP